MPARKQPAKKATVQPVRKPLDAHTQQVVHDTLRDVWRDEEQEEAALAKAQVPFVPQQPVQPIPAEQSDATHPLPASIPTPFASSPADMAFTPPVGWDVLSDEARQIAIDEANRAIERGASEADAITAGVIAAKLWATEHGVNVRK